MSTFQRLKAVAVNIDGVMLTDTFSPVIHRFITSRGGEYTAETERSIFSQRRAEAGWAMARSVPQEMTGPEALETYFRERDEYLAENPVELSPGATGLVSRLRALGLRTVCYGGLGADHFRASLGADAELFDEPGYICTNDFRPGVAEIPGILGLTQGEVVFIDDVAKVSEVARTEGAPFVGYPSTFPHSHQAQLMREVGVEYLVSHLNGVDETLLSGIDESVAAGRLWATAPVN
ncbi:HAD family phosphatase [Streptomyces sp. NBC_01016]|uniref:HAD family phosphatase n=1 Tax=Streptomyces sp. NBC_01016 TaxID=2903720 RepID=UPI00225A786C|nr:HAD family phosphatase [Streptomyces sp. NBC_01016]MCX4834912.1 HAD family phosphatase [Streptomyces sp. NBC_01016]